MKRTQFFGKQLVGLAVAVAFAFCAFTAQALQGYAKVVYVKGQATYTKSGGQPQKIVTGLVLKQGDSIATGADGTVDLSLDYNNGTVRVRPNSDIAFNKLNYEIAGLGVVHDTEMNLRAGTIYGNVRKMDKASKYQVKIPRGVAAVRGTQYAISANGNVTVTDGEVLVSYLPDGATEPVTYTVKAGETFDVSTGKVRAATDAEKNEARTQNLQAETNKQVSTGTITVTPQPDPEPAVSTFK